MEPGVGFGATGAMPDPSQTRRHAWRIGAALLCVGLLFGGIVGYWGARRNSAEEDAGPVLVAMKRIGELHSVTFTMKDVLHSDSSQKPEGWLNSIPGVPEAVFWATHNQVLVTAEGSVEAGVNLSAISEKSVRRVRGADGKTAVVVQLPPVTIYPPNVHVHVESSQTGLLWTDENIVPSAEAEARRRFTETAERGGIRAQAQANAIDRLNRLEAALGSRNIRFSF